ncbi:MAG: peptidylprolyl isomerase [Bacteroidetes bacterium]|nr:peptidylprolyl isomerase [Bacteroidota bacterium]
MNKKYNVFLALLFLQVSFLVAQKPIVADKVIAVVGNKIITKFQLETEYQQYLSQNEIVAGENAKCQILEDLLYKKLLVVQAEKDSVEVSDAQVDQELDRRMRYFVAQFGSEEKFISFYGKTIEQFKEELRDNVYDLLLAKQVQEDITRGVTITPSDIKTYYEKIPVDSLPFINAEVEIGEIVIKPKVSSEAKKIAREKIEELRQRVLKGEKFTSLAILYSEDPGSAKNGGEYKDIPRGQFVPEFDAIAFRIKEGETSEVFETAYGYHFMQLLKRKGEFVDLRHILITPVISSSDMIKAKHLADSVYQLLKSDSVRFEELAGRYSDEEESKSNSGIILNPQTGSPKFEVDQLGVIDNTLFFAIDKLEPGKASEPTLSATRDGKQAYRILYLKSRTNPHKANLKEDYQRIQGAAKAEKETKMVNDWIRKKVQGVFVRIDGDYKDCKFQHEWKSQVSVFSK